MAQPQVDSSGAEDPTDALVKSLAWLHCNECHRGFEHHNRIHVATSTNGDASHAIRIVKSDLHFGFTSCGHFFCDNCFKQHSATEQFVCPLCREPAAEYRLDGVVPKKLEMYMKPPIALLEDSISVMLFQLTNASQLIVSLRAKVSQQKELLGRAKQELASQKQLKDRIAELEAEVQQLRTQNPNSFRPSASGPKATTAASPVIKMPARISLRSPSISINGGSALLGGSRAASPLVTNRYIDQASVLKYPPYQPHQPPPEYAYPQAPPRVAFNQPEFNGQSHQPPSAVHPVYAHSNIGALPAYPPRSYQHPLPLPADFNIWADPPRSPHPRPVQRRYN